MENLIKTMYSNRTAIIIRGLSGSGKTTLAQKIGVECVQNGMSASIHETDTLFMKDGEYKFDPSLLGEYHEKNLKGFCDSIDNGTHIVINCNTNTMHWEYAKYVLYAVQRGYNIQIIDLFDNGQLDDTLHSRQLHDFPRDKYGVCRDRYEREYYKPPTQS